MCLLALRGAEEKVQRERFLRRKRFLGLTGLTAGGFLSLTAFQAEGCGLPFGQCL